MNNQHYHFIGIGGIGMGALASLALDQGMQVTGSDVRANEMVEQLRQKGATIHIQHNKENLAGNVECVVYSSAISSQNPELMEASARGLKKFKRAEFLAKLMEDHVSITVAGAHGKTTTTSLVSCILEKAQLNPTTALGGIVLGTGLHAKTGDGRYFIAEADESDGSFLNYSPHYSIITNIDFEHVDYYGDWDQVIKTYGQFIAKTKEGGCLFVYGDDECLLNLVQESNRKFITFGFKNHNNIIAQNIKQTEYETSFDCLINSKRQCRIILNTPGKHNVCNALAAVSVANTLNIDLPTIQLALKEFKGVKRRFQVLGEVADILVIDDYAHHPSEIKATINTAFELKRKRVVVVFQPHRFSRLEKFMDEFAQSLVGVDEILVTNVYAASEQPISGVDGQSLVNKIHSDYQVQAQFVQRNKLISKISETVRPGDAVLMLGAGDITQFAREYIDTLKKDQMIKAG